MYDKEWDALTNMGSAYMFMFTLDCFFIILNITVQKYTIIIQ